MKIVASALTVLLLLVVPQFAGPSWGWLDRTFKGKVVDILPSEYGMEISVDAGETFFVDVSSDTFKQQPVKELSEVWISFSREAGVALEGTY